MTDLDRDGHETYTQNILRLLAGAFGEYGQYRVTHVEPTGMSNTEWVSAGQLATIAYLALEDAGLVLSPSSER